jgi:hypothetical protein
MAHRILSHSTKVGIPFHYFFFYKMGTNIDLTNRGKTKYLWKNVV